MKEIPLTQGKVAIVDDEDFECVSAVTWRFNQDRAATYDALLCRSVASKTVLMHRFILGMAPGQSWRVRWLNGNKLDNRKQNLFDPRRCTAHEPQAGTKHIPLRPGLCAIVDDGDFDWLSQWKWSPLKQGDDRWKAERKENGKAILMHRQIVQPDDDETVDHRNTNPLDNRRHNLRVATMGEQNLNRRRNLKRRTSSFKGVYWHKASGGHWCVRFRNEYIGIFDDEVEAAVAYDRAAKSFNPEFACLNFPVEGGLRVT